MTVLLGREKRRMSVTTERTAVKLWFIDLDDTVLRSSGGLFVALHDRMNRFLMKEFGLSEEEATEMRQLYWAQYGTTFLGLWRRHGVDPLRFLTETHDFDVRPYLHKTGDPGRALERLPGRKVLYTNAPRNYAEAALTHLRLTHVFDDLVCSTDTHFLGDWAPKPSARMLSHLLARYRVRAAEAAMVDDSFFNLRIAKEAGLRTVCCYGHHRAHARYPMRKPAYVDRMIAQLQDLTRTGGERRGK